MIDVSGENAAKPSLMPPLWEMAKMVLLLSLLTFAASRFKMGGENFSGITPLWPSNAFVVGVLLSVPKRNWPAYLLLAYGIDFTLNLSGHHGVPVCAAVSMCNMLQVLLAAVPLYSVIAPNPDLTQRKQLLAFLFYGVLLAPGIGAFVILLVGLGHLGLPNVYDFYRRFSGDALGMATIVPLYLSLRRSEVFDGRSWREALLLLLLLMGVGGAVFLQTSLPIVFLMLLSLLLVGVRLGLAGSAMGLLLVSLIGGVLSKEGYGPFMPMGVRSFHSRDFIFQ
jgi:integral membrane sensor domain MASE1